MQNLYFSKEQSESFSLKGNENWFSPGQADTYSGSLHKYVSTKLHTLLATLTFIHCHILKCHSVILSELKSFLKHYFSLIIFRPDRFWTIEKHDLRFSRPRVLKLFTFEGIMPCRTTSYSQRFRQLYSTHHQGRRANRLRHIKS